MTDSIEQEIHANGSDKAPRVTPADIEANIAHECYFRPYGAGMDALRFEFLTADHSDMDARALVRRIAESFSVHSASAVRQDIDTLMAIPGDFHEALKTLTFCVLVLRNGFTVTGESACASPENFNAEIGRRIARENAVAKVWQLMGYELRTKLALRAEMKGEAS